MYAALSNTIEAGHVRHPHVACMQVEDDLGRHKRLVAYLKERNGRLSLDNLELNERIRLLERLPMFQYGRESACMLEFTTYKIRETY